MIEGIDVSHYQGTVDWHAVAASGRRFGICKATEHTSVDALFKANWAGIAAAGLHRAAYHYCHPGEDAIKQASAFEGVVRAQATDLLIADFETTDGQSKAACQTWLDTFLHELARLSGFMPVLYTSPLWFDGAVADPGHFAAWPLWVADYRAAPRLPTGFKTWALWQYSSSGTVPGVGGRCDVNRFAGGETALAALFHQSVAPPCPTPVLAHQLLEGELVATIDFPVGPLDKDGWGSVGVDEGLDVDFAKFLTVSPPAPHDPNAGSGDTDYLLSAAGHHEGANGKLRIVVHGPPGATVVPRILVAD